MARGKIRSTCSIFTTAVLAIALVVAAMPLTAQTSAMSDDGSAAVALNTWSSGAPLPTARASVVTGVIGKLVYVVDGATNSGVTGVNEIYNTKTKEWTNGASDPTPRFAAAGAVVGGILYVIGGSDNGSDALSVVESYDPSSDTWLTLAPMPTARNSISAVVDKVADKEIIYVIGGYSSGSRLTTVESYNPGTNTWTEEAPLLVGKSSAAVGLLGATIIAADGLTNSGFTGDSEGYSATKNKWTTLTADPTPRVAACAWAIAGQLYVAGGGNGGPLSVLEAYSSKTKSWATMAPMPQAVLGAGPADVGGKLYCFGGTNNGSLGQGTVYSYVQIYQPGPVLTSMSLDPTVVVAGSTSTGTVALNSAAPAGGAVVALASSNSAAQVPTSVTVAKGATSAQFMVTTSTVTSPTTVSISATYDNSTASATLLVNP